MKVDFELLGRKLRNKTQVGVLSTTECKDMIKPVYDYIKTKAPLMDVFLLNGDGILCPLKTEDFEFFVLLGVPCPIHAFKESVSATCEISSEDLHKLKGYKNVVYDPTYFCPPVEPSSESVLVVTRSQMFYDYYFYRYDAESFYPLEKRDRIQYLASKCNKGERIRGCSIFAIIFTSKVYEELAKSIRKALISRRKNAYLLFLKDLTYERMITIEGTECIVVVDCPLFDCSHIELHIPVVTPFEVEYALSNNWNSKFEKNSFDVSDVPAGGCTEIDLIDRVGRILVRSSGQGVPFGSEDECDTGIHLGLRGTSQGYVSEGS